ncbi:MAG: hypothetical protein IH971_04770 [Candidatus Marinimicrobia bacterium]|nr:hypothetical protein [Candidatus Neomarinimicrobiota bacterium]
MPTPKPTPSTPARDPRGRFLPGVSGNPNGRPRKSPPSQPDPTATLTTPEPVTALVRRRLAQPVSALPMEVGGHQSIGEGLADTLLREALYGRDRLRAVSAVIDRLEGKPRQAADAELPEKPDLVVIG